MYPLRDIFQGNYISRNEVFKSEVPENGVPGRYSYSGYSTGTYTGGTTTSSGHTVADMLDDVDDDDDSVLMPEADISDVVNDPSVMTGTHKRPAGVYYTADSIRVVCTSDGQWFDMEGNLINEPTAVFSEESVKTEHRCPTEGCSDTLKKVDYAQGLTYECFSCGWACFSHELDDELKHAEYRRAS